jgi:hypothetical protein
LDCFVGIREVTSTRLVNSVMNKHYLSSACYLATSKRHTSLTLTQQTATEMTRQVVGTSGIINLQYFLIKFDSVFAQPGNFTLVLLTRDLTTRAIAIDIDVPGMQVPIPCTIVFFVGVRVAHLCIFLTTGCVFCFVCLRSVLCAPNVASVSDCSFLIAFLFLTPEIPDVTCARGTATAYLHETPMQKRTY